MKNKVWGSSADFCFIYLLTIILFVLQICLLAYEGFRFSTILLFETFAEETYLPTYSISIKIILHLLDFGFKKSVAKL